MRKLFGWLLVIVGTTAFLFAGAGPEPSAVRRREAGKGAFALVVIGLAMRPWKDSEAR